MHKAEQNITCYVPIVAESNREKASEDAKFVIAYIALAETNHENQHYQRYCPDLRNEGQYFFLCPRFSVNHEPSGADKEDIITYAAKITHQI